MCPKPYQKNRITKVTTVKAVSYTHLEQVAGESILAVRAFGFHEQGVAKGFDPVEDVYKRQPLQL